MNVTEQTSLVGRDVAGPAAPTAVGVGGAAADLRIHSKPLRQVHHKFKITATHLAIMVDVGHIGAKGAILAQMVAL